MTAALLCISVVLISSASIMEAANRFNDAQHYTIRQVINIGAALAVGVMAAMAPTSFWKNYSLWLMFLTLVLLVRVPVVGREVNEAKRWISLGFFNIQPAEILKLFWIIYFSDYISRKIGEVRSRLAGFIKPMSFIALISGLLLSQPDFGSLVVVTVITFAMLFIAGAGLL